MEKAILLVIALLFVAHGTALAASSIDHEEPKVSVEQADKSPCPPDDKTEAGQRGCCSWHGGVCGCSFGRVECCDGTLSPSCTC